MPKEKKIIEKTVEKEVPEISKDEETQVKVFLRQSNKEIRETCSYLKDWIKDANIRLKNIDNALSCYEKNLKRLTEINSNVEETLTNVLLAIRQNEYLQAWYPEQQGHDEMKVVGRHPCQSKEKI